jgi:hypothetical protein
LSRLLSTLSARRRASMVLRASWLGPRRLLTVDVATPTPSLRSPCREGGRFGPWADGAPACLRSERWREAELSACCAAAASSSAFSCWRTCRSSEVAGSEVLRRPLEEWEGVGVNVGVDVRASIGTSVVVGRRPACRQCRLAVVRLMGSRTALAPVAVPLTHPCTGTSCAGRRSPFPSRGRPCTGTPCAGCRSRALASTPSSWCRRASSSSSWRLSSASSSSRARRWASTPRWRGVGSGSELLDKEATQMLHSLVGSWCRVVRAL